EEAEDDEGLEAHFAAALEDASPVARREWQYILGRDVECSSAADLSEISLQSWGEGEEETGDDVLFPKGYDAIIEGLAKDLDIRTSHVVKKIARSAGGVSVEVAGGTALRARRVVVTLPLGVLKKGSVAFEPELPDAKRGAIERLGMGVLDKVALTFTRPVWTDKTEWRGRVTERR